MRDQAMTDDSASGATVPGDGMSYWRWLLFAAIARVELREDVFLELPDATTVPLEVRVKSGGDGDGSIGR